MVFVKDILSSNNNNSVGLESGKQEASIQATTFRENSGTVASQRMEMRQRLYLLRAVCYFKLDYIGGSGLNGALLLQKDISSS